MKILLVFIFSMSLYAEAPTGKLCNEIVKLSTSGVVKTMEAIGFLAEKITSPICPEKVKKPIEVLVDALLEGNKVVFDKILDELDDTYLFKLLAKIKSEDSEVKGTEVEAFKKFLRSKFNTFSKRITKNEKRIFKQQPLKTLLLYYNYNKGLNYIKKKDPELYQEIEKPHGKADAIRHMFINAVAARFGFDHFVKMISTKREESGGYIEYDEKKWKYFYKEDFKKFNGYSIELLYQCNPEIKPHIIKEVQHEQMLDQMSINRMDIHNNAIGIKIGRDNPCESLDSIYKMVKEKYNSQEAREVISVGGRCFDISSNYPRDFYQLDKRSCYKHSEIPKASDIKYPIYKNKKWLCR